jgi:hypothetical protein
MARFATAGTEVVEAICIHRYQYELVLFHSALHKSVVWWAKSKIQLPVSLAWQLPLISSAVA